MSFCVGLRIYNVKAVGSQVENTFELKQTKFLRVHLLRLLFDETVEKCKGGGGEGSGWGTHVNQWLIHANVWQKPLQYCKVISLQLI